MDGSAAIDPATCDSASCFVLGVAIAGVAAFLYASGLCVQRAALTGASQCCVPRRASAAQLPSLRLPRSGRGGRGRRRRSAWLRRRLLLKVRASPRAAGVCAR